MLFCSNIPPNQGGKYGGFGYQMELPPKSTSQEFFDTAVSSLASVRISRLYFNLIYTMDLFFIPVILNCRAGPSFLLLQLK